jgi:hypothetical protein
MEKVEKHPIHKKNCKLEGKATPQYERIKFHHTIAM